MLVHDGRRRDGRRAAAVVRERQSAENFVTQGSIG
jgi:hypothetical protein